MMKFIYKKALLLIMTLVFYGVGAIAQNAIKVTNGDGDEQIFLLSSSPTVTFEGDDLLIETQDTEVTLPIAGGVTFEFVKSEAGIEKISSETPVYTLTANSIEIKNLKENCQVTVYDTSGKICFNGSADQDGFISISLNSLSKGIYIVNTSTTTFKFFKK